MITHSPAAIIADFLIAEGVFTDPSADSSWPLFIAHEPNSPDECGTIYTTTGVDDGRLMTGVNILHHGIQIRVRGDDYDAAWLQLQDALDSLEGLNNESVVIDSSTYTVFNTSQTGPAIPLGVEPGTRRRFLFTANLLVSLREE